MIEIGRTYTFEICGITHDGCGIGFVEGIKVFVDGILPGETAVAEIYKIEEDYAAARLISIINPRTPRVEPFCRHFDVCGGCSLQNIPYSEQLKVKRDIVIDAMKRAGVCPMIVRDTIGMKDPFRYRNKGRYPAAIEGLTAVIGCYKTRSIGVIDITECGIQHEDSNLVRKAVKWYISECDVSVFDRNSGTGLLREVITRISTETGEVMVILAVNGDGLPHVKKLIECILQAVPKVKSIYVNVNKGRTSSTTEADNILIFGRPTISDYIGRYRFEIPPMAFFQVNSRQTRTLYDKVLEYCSLTGSETVFDLYCGIGTISLYLSGSAEKVIGVEALEEAVRYARLNAAANSAENVEFVAGRAEKVLDRLATEGRRADVVVLDPPRKGCKAPVLKAIVEMKPERVVYVSCNPTTMARDLKYLDANGYRAIEVQPVDMFPHTAHVECVVSIKSKHIT